MFHSRDMHYCESIPQCFLLEFMKSRIWDVVDGAVRKDFQERLVVNTDDKVVAA